MSAVSPQIARLHRMLLACKGVCTDTRQLCPSEKEPGPLFFALKGESFDGNRYAATALENGASYAVVDDAKTVRDERYVLVEDTLTALQQLAACHRRYLGLPILALTGSNGKTTTKELLVRVLSQKYRTHSTQGNLNNHIGVPLTLLQMTPGTELGIVEMGANHPGEIALLCEIASPDYGVITNIGRAHLEGFGGPEGIRTAKGELYDWLNANGGTAFYRADDPVIREMAFCRDTLHKIPYSTSDYRPLPASSTLSIRLKREKRDIHTHLIGDYNIANIACAVAVGEFFNVPLTDMVSALEDYVPDNFRSQQKDTGRNRLIIDAYNANPSSMEVALGHFLRADHPRKAVVLGDMKELGAYAAEEHKRVLEQLQEAPLEAIWVIGPEFCKAARESNLPGLRCFPDTQQAADYLQKFPFSGNTVLLKGSRSIGLERLLEGL